MLSRLRPVHRAALTSATFMAAGDVMCQTITARRSGGQATHAQFDPVRTLRFAFVGLTFHGPFFFKGFQILDDRFGTRADLRTAVIKSLAGHATLFPIFTSLFLVYTGLLEGLAPAAVLDRVQDRLPTLLVGGSLYWPVVNVANFALLAPSQRVLGVSACSLVWNAYMSFVTAGDGSSSSSSSSSK